jgi:hypothetical protein
MIALCVESHTAHRFASMHAAAIVRAVFYDNLGGTSVIVFS